MSLLCTSIAATCTISYNFGTGKIVGKIVVDRRGSSWVVVGNCDRTVSPQPDWS